MQPRFLLDLHAFTHSRWVYPEVTFLGSLSEESLSRVIFLIHIPGRNVLLIHLPTSQMLPVASPQPALHFPLCGHLAPHLQLKRGTIWVIPTPGTKQEQDIFVPEHPPQPKARKGDMLQPKDGKTPRHAGHKPKWGLPCPSEPK